MLRQMSKQTFLAEIHAAHEPFAAAAAALTDAELTDVLPDMDRWTRKDVLAHVGWWSDHSVRIITALRAGDVPYQRDPNFDIDTQNRSIRDEFRDRDADEMRSFEAAAFERLVGAVEAASEEELFTAGRYPWLEGESLAAAVEWDATKHYPDHLAHVTT